MHILVLTREFPPWILGGISYHLSYLYDELASLDHDVTIVTGKCWNYKAYNEELIPENVEIIPVSFGVRQGYHFLSPAALTLKTKRIDLNEYDVAVSHTPLFNEVDLPLVTKYHDCMCATRTYYYQNLSLPARVIDSLINPVRKRIERASISVSDMTIFNSQLCLDCWDVNYGVDAPSEVIYNGVDLSIFYPREVPTDTEYVLFVGSEERKGLSQVIEFGKQSEYSVRIVGCDGDNSIEGVEFVGRVEPEELARLYSGAFATIHPTHFEAFGNVVLESIACGTPVVTTDTCGAAEILNEQCARVTDDLESGVEEVQDLNSHDCVEQARNYSWDQVARDTEAILQRVVDEY